MGHAFLSPLRRWDVIVGLCQSVDARMYVEVGCKDGRTTGAVLAQCPQIHAVAIDPWAKLPKSDDPTRETYEDWDFTKIENEFWDNVCSCKWNKAAHQADCSVTRCTMLRESSQQAAHYWNYPEDHPCVQADVIFIDALHDYESVTSDIARWWPKVREGGYLCGHDYQHKFPGVMRAVAAAFPLLRVAVCPDSVWVVHKDASIQLREAA